MSSGSAVNHLLIDGRSHGIIVVQDVVDGMIRFVFKSLHCVVAFVVLFHQWKDRLQGAGRLPAHLCAMDVQREVLRSDPVMEILVGEIIQITDQILTSELSSVVEVVVEENPRSKRMVGFGRRVLLDRWCRFVENKLSTDEGHRYNRSRK